MLTYFVCLLHLWHVCMCVHVRLLLSCFLNVCSTLLSRRQCALWQISTFASFLVGNKCDLINPFLVAWFNDQLHGDDTCFDVEAKLGSGSVILFVSALLAFAVGQTVTLMAHRAIEERLHTHAVVDEEEDDGVNKGVAGRRKLPLEQPLVAASTSLMLNKPEPGSRMMRLVHRLHDCGLVRLFVADA
jgi:hypothetical protein